MNETDTEVQETEDETQEGAATDQEAAPSNVQTFDAGAAEARIREQVEAEYEAKYRAQTPQAVPDSNEPPDRWTDPDAYDAWRDAQLLAKIEARFAPTIKAVETDRVVNTLGDGLGQAGKQYLRENLGGVPLDQMPPALRDMAMRAARDKDREANPPRNAVNPERSTTNGNPLPSIANDPDLQRFLRYMSPEEVAKYVKENP